jgi:hypothetical protein
MYVFQTFKTKRDPDTGKRVSVLDAKGRRVPHSRWRFEYVTWQGKRKVATGSTSRVETEKLVQRVQAKEDEIRKGFRPSPNASANTQPGRLTS